MRVKVRGDATAVRTAAIDGGRKDATRQVMMTDVARAEGKQEV
jgi:hypothetical protein